MPCGSTITVTKYEHKANNNDLYVTFSYVYDLDEFLANVNSRSRSLYAIARPSVCSLSVTLVRPTQAVEIFGNIFYGIRYLGHPLTSIKNFTEIVPEEPLRRGS